MDPRLPLPVHPDDGRIEDGAALLLELPAQWAPYLGGALGPVEAQQQNAESADADPTRSRTMYLPQISRHPSTAR
jgi:hypothetical protein